MAACGGRGETVEQYRSEVERLSHELAEANREKIRAAECGLVVLEENQTLKQKYADLEAEQEILRQELEQLQEVNPPSTYVALFIASPSLRPFVKRLSCDMVLFARCSGTGPAVPEGSQKHSSCCI